MYQNGNLLSEYFFDGEGKRVKKKVIENGVVSEETIFVYSNGKLIAEYSTVPPPNPTTSYTVTDQLGSPRVIVISLGQVTSRRDFLPFGEPVPNDGSFRPIHLYPVNDSIRQKFTGYQKDDETGLDFAEARMYENRHGRFTAVDPLLASGKSANPQTFNRYVYVVNNPMIFVDPDGLQVATAAGKVYRRGGNFAIFRGSPYAGYKPVTRTINTQTTIGGVQHQLTVTPSGWTVGDRIDNMTFAPPAAPVSQGPPGENAAIRALAANVSSGVSDGTTGIFKGIGNSPAVMFNGITGTLLNHAGGGLIFGGSNPLAIPLPFGASNAREGSYMSASSTGTLLGAGVAGGTIFGGSSTLSVVPESSSSQVSSLVRFYPENNGFLGATERTFLMPGDQISRYGSTSGRFFSPSDTPLSMRSLPPNANTSIYNNYTVLKPFEVEAGQVAPAFGQPGLGTQFRSPVPADVLLRRGIVGQP